MGLFDSHAHYDDPRFAGDLDEIVKRISQPSEICPCGVEYVINIGCDVPTSRLCVELSDRYDLFYTAVGIHPQDADRFDENTLSDLEEMLKHEKTVAIGEIGLDYKYENSPRDVQKKVFRTLLDFSVQTGYPVCIHDRDAHGDVFDILREFPKAKGVLHSYSGSAEMARQLLRMGWYLSFSGTVTFKNANGILEAARVVPKERLLVETDAPYLAPVPFRGKRNHSDYAYKTVEKLAELHHCSAEEMVEITKESALSFFRF